MDQHNDLYVRIDPEGILQSHRIHIPGIPLGIDKYSLTAFISDGVHCCVKGHIRAEHLMSCQSSADGIRLAVNLLGRKLNGQMQCAGSGGKTHTVFPSHLLCRKLLHLVDVLTHSGHPVGGKGLLDVGHFRSVHGGGRKPYLFLEPFDLSLRLGGRGCSQNLPQGADHIFHLFIRHAGIEGQGDLIFILIVGIRIILHPEALVLISCIHGQRLIMHIAGHPQSGHILDQGISLLLIDAVHTDHVQMLTGFHGSLGRLDALDRKIPERLIVPVYDLLPAIQGGGITLQLG